MPKIKSNHLVLKNDKVKKDKFDALVSSAMIAFVFWKYGFEPNENNVSQVLQCLKFPVDETVCGSFMAFLNAFDKQIPRFVGKSANFSIFFLVIITGF